MKICIVAAAIIKEKAFFAEYLKCLVHFQIHIEDITNSVLIQTLIRIVSTIQIKSITEKNIEVHGHDTVFKKKKISTRFFAWWI